MFKIHTETYEQCGSAARAIACIGNPAVENGFWITSITDRNPLKHGRISLMVRPGRYPDERGLRHRLSDIRNGYVLQRELVR